MGWNEPSNWSAEWRAPYKGNEKTLGLISFEAKNKTGAHPTTEKTPIIAGRNNGQQNSVMENNRMSIPCVEDNLMTKSATLLGQIQSGLTRVPRRILLYGTHGIGKSTFASLAPKPIFIQTEDGLGQIECDKFPLTKSYENAITALSELFSENHPYRTVVIDSLDWLESIIWAEVCKKKSVKNIEDIGYKKGYIFALDYWRDIIAGLEALRNEKNMTIVLIAHAQIEKVENPETDSYDRYSPRLHKKSSTLVQEWCDEILFASYKIHTKQTDEGFNKKRTQGIGTGERTLRTIERPAYIAKNRLNLPDELPLDWNAYAKYINNGEIK